MSKKADRRKRFLFSALAFGGIVGWVIFLVLSVIVYIGTPGMTPSGMSIVLMCIAVAFMSVGYLGDWAAAAFERLKKAETEKDLLERAILRFVSQDVADAELSRGAVILQDAYNKQEQLQQGTHLVLERLKSASDPDTRADIFRFEFEKLGNEVALAKKEFWDKRYNLLKAVIAYLNKDADFGVGVPAELSVKNCARYSDYLPGSEYLESKKQKSGVEGFC